METFSPGIYFESKAVARLANMCAKFALVVMVLGSAVRATDSGLACPDWPMCFDQPIPFFDFHIFLEWFHRLAAGIFAVAVAYLGFRILRSDFLRSKMIVPVLGLALLLIWQIILGGLTVLELLNPKIVSWHLMNAVLLYGFIEYVGIKAAYMQYRALMPFELDSKLLLNGLRAITGLVFLQIFLGGMVSSNEAGLMCPDFPRCFGMWWTNISWLSNLQMLHRYVAFCIVVFSMLLSICLMRSPLPQRVRRVVSSLPILIAGQVLLGAINVLWQLPAWASVGHLAMALLIFSILFVATSEYQLLCSHSASRVDADPEKSGKFMNPKVAKV